MDRIFTKDMFVTGDDQEIREIVSSYDSGPLHLVGLALRDERETVNKITKGSKLHG